MINKILNFPLRVAEGQTTQSSTASMYQPLPYSEALTSNGINSTCYYKIQSLFGKPMMHNW